MKKWLKPAKWIAIPLLTVIIVSTLATGLTSAHFHDTELSHGDGLSAWTSTAWTQTSQADFDSGVLNNVTTFYPGHAELSATTALVFINSYNTDVSTTSTAFVVMKTLTFTKVGSTYDEIRIDSNIKANSPRIAYSSICINGEEVASHFTSNTVYQYFEDIIDTSGLPDGTHTVTLEMCTSQSNRSADNSLFEIYRTQAYASSGTLASQVLDTNNDGARWDALFWDKTLPSGTDITFEVRASDTPFLKTDTGPSWTAVGGTSPVLSIPASPGRYQQWRATLATLNNEVSPSLYEARVYYVGPPVEITDIDNITGTPQIGHVLSAGALTPAGATAAYQWQRCNTIDGTYIDISGAVSGTYTVVPGDNSYYIRVSAAGFGNYTGTVISTPVGPVTEGTIPITAIGTVIGTTQVGQTVFAGALTPSDALATYQWQWSTTIQGMYQDISGAVSNVYTMTTEDLGYYLRVVATGTGGYSGTVISTGTGPVAIEITPITAIGAIIGTAQVSQTVAAGDLTPSGALATYQWQRSETVDGTYNDISGAISDTYTLTIEDLGQYLRVVATGMGSYSGTVTSTSAGPVASAITPITAVGSIIGTVQVDQTVTAGDLTPYGATAAYQWQRSNTIDGTYTDISGAVSDTYTLTVDDYQQYIRVVAIGTGNYNGTVNSSPAGPAGAGVITNIGAIAGTLTIGSTLTAGDLTPLSANATYQWQYSSDALGTTFIDIDGATSNTYLIANGSYLDRYLRVVATGAGAYTGTVSATTVSRVSNNTTPITAIGATSGNAQVGQILTAGSLTPSGATATYQWQRSTTIDGIYEDITGGTNNSYTLASGDLDFYFKVVATGSGSYTGTVTSEAVGPVAPGVITAIGPIIGTAVVGQTLTAGTLTPLSATVTWQWKRSTTAGGTYTDISGATSNTYTLIATDNSYYIKVVATGTASYTGTATSTYTGPVTTSSTPLTAIGPVAGTAQVGQILTAGAVTPSGATVTYQWQRSATADGTYTNISGATSGTYTVTEGDYTYYFKVTATGSGNYSGTVTSAAFGPIEAGVITDIGPIAGTAQIGQTLTAGSLTPYGATAAYKWQYSDDSLGTNFYDIPGAINTTYTIADGTYLDRYIRIVATGTGAYTGQVHATTVSRVVSTTTPLTAIGAIGGTAQVGQTLTAGSLTPAGATATYQWKRSATAGGTYANIIGATANSYTLISGDYGYYLKVVATGAGSYSGTVTSVACGPVTAGIVTAIGNIIGSAVVDETLTAGSLTPAGATVTYQWQKAPSAGGTYSDISDATSNIYTVTADDSTYYVRVIATGTGSYTGAATSAPTGPVTSSSTPVTAIGAIGGTVQVSQTLAAGILTPAGATATYQWKRSATADGTYSNISGAMSSTYTLTSADYTYYIKVVATGSGSYSGTVTSAAVGPVTAAALTAIGPITGTAAVGQTLTAGALTPAGATVTYRWQYSDPDVATNFQDIPGATNPSYYIVNAEYSNRYLRVIATGIGAYSGTVYATTATRVSSSSTPITAIGAISGTAQVAQILTAGSLTPSGATATYQWQRSAAVDGVYANIPGATSSSYTVAAGDYTYYIKVVATGSGSYSGTVMSAAVGPVNAGAVTAIGAINGTAVTGQTLTAGAVTPSGATVNYQWKRSTAIDGMYADISGAASNIYTVAEADLDFYIKVVVTGIGSYTGTAASDATGPVTGTSTPITAIDTISGTVQVAQTLTAGSLTPAGATATYQWQRCSIIDGTYTNISGAVSSTYTLTATDYTYYIKVVATGSGSYSGTVTSAAVGPVDTGIITGIGAPIGSPLVGSTVYAGEVTPSGATVTYQWQYSDWAGTTWTNIPGATSNSYYIVNLQYRPGYLRVVVTGTGAYTGTATSTRTTVRIGG